MKRVKLVLSYERLARALGLAADIEIVNVVNHYDPDRIHIYMHADWFSDQPELAEIPQAGLDYVR